MFYNGSNPRRCHGLRVACPGQKTPFIIESGYERFGIAADSGSVAWAEWTCSNPPIGHISRSGTVFFCRGRVCPGIGRSGCAASGFRSTCSLDVPPAIFQRSASGSALTINLRPKKYGFKKRARVPALRPWGRILPATVPECRWPAPEGSRPPPLGGSCPRRSGRLQ